MAVKDPVAVLEPGSGAAKSIRRDAVGAEIPVTVHASRTTQGLGKNLPAVHEDTKTVIVLQQGAVLRLTANLMTGETVVLTNRMTGADVLCRVGKIKSQPGIQHYVDLEFIQRAPGFWGDALAAVTAPLQEPAAAPLSSFSTPTPVAAPVAIIPPQPPPSAPVAVSAPRQTPVAAKPPASTAIPAPPPPPPAAATTNPTPTAVAPPPPPPALAASAPPPSAPPPHVELPGRASAKTLDPDPLAEPIAPPWKPSHAKIVTPIRGGLSEPTFAGISEERSGRNTSGSRKGLIAAAAAVLLVLGGGAVGYWFYSHQTASPGDPATQPAVAVVPAPVMPDLTPISVTTPDAATPAVSAPAPEAQMDAVIESRAFTEALAARVQPAPASPPRATATARRNAVPIGKLQAPKARTTTARIDSSEPPPAPAMMGAVSLGDPAAAGALLTADSTGPAPPPGSVPPPVGGQFQQPILISSTAAVYPSAARMQRIQGTVVLDALVDETGKVVETKVIAGPQPLRLAAQEAVRNWRYRPAQLNGKPIAVRTKVSVRFNLQ